MGMKVSSKGDWEKTRSFFDKMLRRDFFSQLDIYGEMGVSALEEATPQDTGLTAHSWAYRIIDSPAGPRIEWYNSNDADGTPVVVLIQYGHGTGTGGYVHGRDFINPAMRTVFDDIVDDMWKQVKNG